MLKAKINDNTTYTVDQKEGIRTVNGLEIIADFKTLKPGTYHYLINNKSYNINVIESDKNSKQYQLRINGKNFDVQLRDRYDDLLHELGLDTITAAKISDLKAPMPGLVVDILVQENSVVKKGDTLVILEAMKMENSLKATADTVVKKVMVKKGHAVEKNEVLVQLS
jgi:acetyl/propionyl-CoA carboxylase alpha subunit